MSADTITVTLTWRGAAHIIAAALVNGNQEGRKQARAELGKMAAAADLAVGQEKAIGEMQTRIATLELQRKIGLQVVERFLGIDDWNDELIAPASLIRDARELLAVAKKAGVKS